MSVSLLAIQNLFTFYLFYYNSCLLLVGTHFHKVPSVSTFLLGFLDNQANIMIRVDIARAICKEMFFSASQTSALRADFATSTAVSSTFKETLSRKKWWRHNSCNYVRLYHNANAVKYHIITWQQVDYAKMWSPGCSQYGIVLIWLTNVFPACYSEKSIAKARAVVYIKEKGVWKCPCPGGLEKRATVHIYHHPVNNTYRIVGRLEEDLSVCLLLVNVKSFCLYLQSARMKLCLSYTQWLFSTT